MNQPAAHAPTLAQSPPTCAGNVLCRWSEICAEPRVDRLAPNREQPIYESSPLGAAILTNRLSKKE